MKKTRKKLLAGLVATFALALSVGFSACDFSEFLPEEEGNSNAITTEFNFKLNGDTYSIAGRGTDVDGILEFPSEFEGKPVTAIEPNAFAGDIKLGRIIVPDSIKTIGEGAFSSCTKLTQAFLGNGVETIEKNAFFKCFAMNKLDMPEALVTIGESAFEGCAKIKTLELPDGLVTISDRAFYDCNWIETVTFGRYLALIGNEAFRACKSLKEVVIPDGAPTVIGNSAFTPAPEVSSNNRLNMKLSYVELGNSVRSVGNNAFASCVYIREIVLGDNLEDIGAKAFYNCRRVAKMTIGTRLPTIGTDAFGNLYVLREVADYSGRASSLFPNVWYVRKAGQETRVFFDDATGLIFYVGPVPVSSSRTENGAAVIAVSLDDPANIVVPEIYNGQPVIMIAERALYNEEFVNKLDTGDSCKYIGAQVAQNAYSLIEVKLGASVKTIADSAFMNTLNLTKVYFYCGTNLTSVGSKAFYKKRNSAGIVETNYTNIYFKGTESEWDTVKTLIKNAGSNDDLFTGKVEYVTGRQ